MSEFGLLIEMLNQIGQKFGIFDYYIVDTALARMHVNDDGTETMVLNLYPKWQGTFGQAPCATVYLDNASYLYHFRLCSGADPATFKVSEMQAGPIRKVGQSYAWENKFRPFGLLMAAQEDSGDAGKKKKKRVLYWHNLAGDTPKRPADDGRPLAIRSAQTDPAPALAPQPAAPQPAANGFPAGSWAGAVSRFGSQQVIKTREIADWLGDKVFGEDRPGRSDDLYYEVLMAYEAAVGNFLRVDPEDKKGAHAAGIASIDVLLEAKGNL